jgi:hypothetical protein
MTLFPSNLYILYIKGKIIKNILIIKKQKFTTVSLKFNKTNVANLNYIKGGIEDLSAKSNCCTKGNIYPNSLTTTPYTLHL